MLHRSIVKHVLPVTVLFFAGTTIADEDIDAVEVSVGAKVPIRLVRFDHDDANITIDGRLDERAWKETPTSSKLKVVEPDTLVDPRYRTDIRFFYTERGLYVSYDLEQPADTLLKRFTARDDFRAPRDNVSMTLDISGEGRFGYWMTLALGDNQADGTVLPERQFKSEWDGAWYGATTETDTGWSAEYFIPWSQMAMPEESGVRRIGFYGSRKVGYLDERWGWPALPNSLPQFMSALQPLELEGVDLRQQWSVFPYASATGDFVEDETRYKAGVDLFWRPKSNFQLSATLNPDFGSVEADDIVVNLTANETFFPEKRLFFQEGREIFDTTPRSGGNGNGRQRFTVLNTRRIGGKPRSPNLPDDVDLSDRESLRRADLYGAAKATGVFGSFRYGLIAAFEDDTEYRADDGLDYVQEGRDFGAFRVLYEDSKGAAYRGLGFISTVVAHPESDAYVNAVDYHYLTTNAHWGVDGQVLHSDTDDDGGGDGAYADITYAPRQGISNVLKLTYFDETVEVNDFGFSQRNDLRDVQYTFEWVKSGLTRVRNIKISPFFRHAENSAGRNVLGAYASRFDVTFNNLHFFSAFAAYFPERFDDQNSFDNGTFRINARNRFNAEYRTNTANVFSIAGRIEYEEESTDGTKLEYKAILSWRPGSNLNLNLEVEYTDRDAWLLHQEDENFTTFVSEGWKPKLNLDYFINAKQELRLALQWVGINAVEDRFYTLPAGTTDLIEGPKPPGESDSFSISQLAFQIRYRWQIAPLSDLFIVYTKGAKSELDLMSFRDLFEDSWDNPLGEQITVKLRYRLGS